MGRGENWVEAGGVQRSQWPAWHVPYPQLVRGVGLGVRQLPSELGGSGGQAVLSLVHALPSEGGLLHAAVCSQGPPLLRQGLQPPTATSPGQCLPHVDTPRARSGPSTLPGQVGQTTGLLVLLFPLCHRPRARQRQRARESCLRGAGGGRAE